MASFSPAFEGAYALRDGDTAPRRAACRSEGRRKLDISGPQNDPLAARLAAPPYHHRLMATEPIQAIRDRWKPDSSPFPRTRAHVLPHDSNVGLRIHALPLHRKIVLRNDSLRP